MVSTDKIRKEKMKRRAETLFKKANELSVLCDTEVSMILLSKNDHQFYQHMSTGNMNDVLEKVELCLNGVNPANLREQQILQEAGEAVAVNGEPEKVEDQIPLKNRYLFDDEDFRFISLRDARIIEQELSKGLRFIDDKKEKILKNSLLPPQNHDNKDCRINEVEETQQHYAVPMKKPIYYNFFPLRDPSAEDAIVPFLAEKRDGNEDSLKKVDEIQLPVAPEKKHEYCDFLSLRLPSDPVASSSRNEDGIAPSIAEKHDNKGWFKNVEENEQHCASVKHESSLTPDCCVLSLRLPSPAVSSPRNEDEVIPFVAEKRDNTDCFKNVEEIQQHHAAGKHESSLSLHYSVVSLRPPVKFCEAMMKTHR